MNFPFGQWLASTGNRLVRLRDLKDHYSLPSKEASRLVDRGILAKVAPGYYVVIPENRRDGSWRPEIEDLALALGVADYGSDRSALVGPSAARRLGAIPRALNTGVIAAPVHRSPLETPFGRVLFSARDTGRLDLQRVSTELVDGYQTSAEQTLLDLASNPHLGGISELTAMEARRDLLPKCDLDSVSELAKSQRRSGALRRILAEARMTA